MLVELALGIIMSLAATILRELARMDIASFAKHPPVLSAINASSDDPALRTSMTEWCQLPEFRAWLGDINARGHEALLSEAALEGFLSATGYTDRAAAKGAIERFGTTLFNNYAASPEGHADHFELDRDTNEKVTELLARIAPCAIPQDVQQKLLETANGLGISVEQLPAALKDYCELREFTESRAAETPARDERERQVAVLVGQGDVAGAMPLIQAIYVESAGAADERNQSAAAYAFEMAKALSSQIKYYEALEWYERAAARDPDNALYLNDYGQHLYVLGSYAEAIEYFKRALNIWRETLGDKHPNVAASYSNIGESWHKREEYGRAIDYYMLALGINRTALGEGHPNVATTYNNIGASWYSLREYEKAIGYFERAFGIDLKTLAKYLQNVAQYYNKIGWAGHSLGEHQKAIELYDLAIEILIKGHPDTATDYNNIGGAWDSISESKDSIRYYERALAIDSKALARYLHNVARDYNNIGEMGDLIGEHQKAIELYELAIEILLKAVGKDHPHVAITYNNIGSAWYSLGDVDKAREYMSKAYEIVLKRLGPEHPHTSRFKADLDSLGR